MSVFTRLTCLVLVALIACGGGGASEPAAPSADPEAERRAESERKLRAAQESAAEAMCERLVDCSIEAARANMTPEEVANLDLEKTTVAARAECEDESSQRAWSPRQIRVVQRCVVEAEVCEALHTCLDEAKKR